MAYGEIGSIKHTVTVKTGTSFHPFVIRVGPGVFAVFYQHDGTGLVLKTYSVNAAGTISNVSVTDTVVDPLNVLYIHVIHISGTIYAAVYRGGGNDGFITTVDIATDGTINDANIATCEFSTHDVWYPFMCHVQADIYAITYYDSVDVDGVIASVTISTDGTTIALEVAWHFYSLQMYWSSCFKISDGIVWVTFADEFTLGYMFCVAISDTGAITAVRITDWNYIALNENRWPIRVGPQRYALAAHWTGNDGFVSSLPIADNGTITKSWDDYLEFDTVECRDVQILSLGGIYYAVCYRGQTGYWRIATFWIDTAGSIRNTNIDTFNSTQIIEVQHHWCWALQDIYIVAYANTVHDVFISSINIESVPPAAAIHHEMLMGM